MNAFQFHEKLANVLKNFTPTPQEIEVVQKTEFIIQVKIVSDVFDGLSNASRFSKLNDLIEKEEPEIASNYIIIFEALTKSEAHH